MYSILPAVGFITDSPNGIGIPCWAVVGVRGSGTPGGIPEVVGLHWGNMTQAFGEEGNER